MSLDLYPFRYRDPLNGRWVKSRYKATRDEISARYAEWAITGPPELRMPIDGAFSPHRKVDGDERSRLAEMAPQLNPHRDGRPSVDAFECFLTLLFLRRYVAYCARRRHFAAMEGAVRLHREVLGAQRVLQGMEGQ